MVRHTLKILQQMLQDFLSTSDHFGTLGINGLFFFILFIKQCHSWMLVLKNKRFNKTKLLKFRI